MQKEAQRPSSCQTSLEHISTHNLRMRQGLHSMMLGHCKKVLFGDQVSAIQFDSVLQNDKFSLIEFEPFF